MVSIKMVRHLDSSVLKKKDNPNCWGHFFFFKAQHDDTMGRCYDDSYV